MFLSIIGVILFIATCIFDKVKRDTIKQSQQLKQLVITGIFLGFALMVIGMVTW